MNVQRMAMVVGIRPEKIAEYKRLHAEPWPEMNAALRAAHISNYSIYLREPENLLFGYWEYTGSDYAGDMKALGELANHQTLAGADGSLQAPLASAGSGEWWSFMPEVFHLD